MQFVKTARVAASSDKVWRVFAHDFDRAYVWMASIPHSYSETTGHQFVEAKSAGRVCELNGNPDGMKASEQFLAYDEANKTCTIRIDFRNTMALFPVDHNRLTFSLVDVGEGQSEMTWAFSSQIKWFAYPIWPLIRIGFGVFVGQIMEELKHFVEHDAPHPRKVRALAKQATSARA